MKILAGVLAAVRSGAHLRPPAPAGVRGGRLAARARLWFAGPAEASPRARRRTGWWWLAIGAVLVLDGIIDVVDA